VKFYQLGRQISVKHLEVSYWDWLQDFHNSIVNNTDSIPADDLGQQAEIGQPLFQVGLLGYFGYELKRESLPGYVYRPDKFECTEKPDPDTQLIFANKTLWLDNYTKTWRVLGLVRRGTEDPIAADIGLPMNVGLAESEFDDFVYKIKTHFREASWVDAVQPVALPTFIALDDEKSYSKSIRLAQDAIREGESYEMTMTTKFRATSENHDSYALYLSLRSKNPAPYSGFLHFPHSDTSLLSSSPERFISIDRNGIAEMKPIKGTIATSPDSKENEKRKNFLATDKKELAENLMVLWILYSNL
jgi:para-aminobenzoate synthetase